MTPKRRRSKRKMVTGGPHCHFCKLAILPGEKYGECADAIVFCRRHFRRWMVRRIRIPAPSAKEKGSRG